MEALLTLDDADWAGIEEFRVFGGGPLDRVIRDAAKTLEAAGRPIVVGGYLDKSKAADLIAWSDYLVLPSRIESIPVIFSDAMQLGTPIIATPVGDLPRLHERYDFGVLADSVDPVDLAGALRAALHTDPASFAPGIALAIADFDLARIAERFLDTIGMART